VSGTTKPVATAGSSNVSKAVAAKGFPAASSFDRRLLFEPPRLTNEQETIPASNTATVRRRDNGFMRSTIFNYFVKPTSRGQVHLDYAVARNSLIIMNILIQR